MNVNDVKVWKNECITRGDEYDTHNDRNHSNIYIIVYKQGIYLVLACQQVEIKELEQWQFTNSEL